MRRWREHPWLFTFAVMLAIGSVAVGALALAALCSWLAIWLLARR